MTEKKSKQKREENTNNKIKNHKTKSIGNFLREKRIKRLFKKEKRKTSFKRVAPGKKEKLTKQGRRTKWAPVWVVLKKFGPGKRIHPSAITKFKRSWRRGKLHIRPMVRRPRHYG